MNEMNYAVVENGTVTNIIWLYPANASDFPDAVPCGDLPVAIGDTYDGEHFYRGGVQVLSALEQAQQEAADMQAALALLGVENDAEVTE